MSINSSLVIESALLLLDFLSMMGSKGKFSRKIFSGKTVIGAELNKKLSTELVLFGITAFDRSRAISQIEERTYVNEERIKMLAKAFDASAFRNDSKRFLIQEIRKANQFDSKFSRGDLVIYETESQSELSSGIKLACEHRISFTNKEFQDHVFTHRYWLSDGTKGLAHYLSIKGGEKAPEKVFEVINSVIETGIRESLLDPSAIGIANEKAILVYETEQGTFGNQETPSSVLDLHYHKAHFEIFSSGGEAKPFIELIERMRRTPKDKNTQISDDLKKLLAKHKSAEEKISIKKYFAKLVAMRRGWKFESDIAKNNNRDVYSCEGTEQKVYLLEKGEGYHTLQRTPSYFSVDTCHGHFEIHDWEGKHLTEVTIDMKVTPKKGKEYRLRLG